MNLALKLNLGCSFRHLPGYVNIDIREDVGADMVHDIETGIPYKTDTVDEVRAYDFLEHVRPERTLFVMREIWRVLRPGGILDHLTPSTDGRGAFQDPTHRSFWNINSWLYYTDDRYRRLINTPVKYKVLELKDIMTGDMVIHTRGRLEAIKDEVSPNS